ncbi:hypothetical protein HDU92_007739 [Lobulomyces angularis]|nr:hypothetical protein HDU92_007739 [Lobulomyces angularis]
MKIDLIEIYKNNIYVFLNNIARFMSNEKSISFIEKKIYSGIKACEIYPFNGEERTLDELDIFSNNTDDLDGSEIKKSVNKYYNKPRKAFIYNLLWCITKKNDVVACNYKFVEGYKMLISCNQQSNLKHLRKILRKITEYIYKISNMDLSKNNAEKYLDSGLSKEILQYLGDGNIDNQGNIEPVKGKICNRLNNLRRKLAYELMSEPEIKEIIDKVDNEKLNHIDITHELFMNMHNNKVNYKNMDKKLKRKILKTICVFTLPSDIKKLISRESRKKIILTLVGNYQVLECKSDHIEILNWENTIKLYLGQDTNIEEIRKYILKKYQGEEKDNNRLKNSINATNEENVTIIKHCEMNIIEHMLKEGTLLLNSNETTKIIVSKLCCYMCKKVIEFLNNKNYNIEVSGSHGKIYSNWMIPNINFIDIYIEKLLSNIIERLRDQKNRQNISDSDSDKNTIDDSIPIDPDIKQFGNFIKRKS